MSDQREYNSGALWMRRNGYSGASGQKTEPLIRSGDLDFLKGKR